MATGAAGEGATKGMILGRSKTTGVVWAFCDRICQCAFLGAGLAAWGPAEIEMILPEHIWWIESCISCRWCGYITSAPATCALHGSDPCPEYAWESSGQTASFARGYIRLTGTFVPDLAWEAAEELSYENPLATGAELAHLVVEEPD